MERQQEATILVFGRTVGWDGLVVGFKFKATIDDSGRKLFVNEPRCNRIAKNDANKVNWVLYDVAVGELS